MTATSGPADTAAAPADEVIEDAAGETSRPEQVPIPRHPLVAAAIVVVILASFAIFGLEPRAFIAAIGATVLVVLAAIDIEHRLLPNRIIAPAFVVLLAAQLVFYPDRALEWLLAGPAAAAFLALPLLFRRDAMGMGDIKLVVLLGVIVGWGVFTAIVIACLAMLPFALMIRLRDGSIRGATLPFGPFLAFGTLLVLFAGGG
jgi:leader peptidase (prepilin peptidase)/N-methyltransferase